MDDKRRDQLRRAKHRWRTRHETREADKRRQVRRFAAGLAHMQLTEQDVMPWLEQLGRAQPSPWRSRARDCWDAWQLLCEQQHRLCFGCGHERPLVGVCRKVDGSVVGALCQPCADALALAHDLARAQPLD